MRRLIPVILMVCGLATALVLTSFNMPPFKTDLPTEKAPAKGSWVKLLDKDLTQWRSYLGYSLKNSYDGKKPVDDKGVPIEPVGYDKDPKNVFSMINQNNEAILRISGEIYGCLFTKQEYENYQLRLKVKWGNIRYEPRLQKLKDSGILYHSVGDAGVEHWRAWMLSQEFQIMQGHMGDFWAQANSAIDIRAFLPEGKMNCVADEKQAFLPFGSGSAEGYCMRSGNYESPEGQWTTIDLICYEGKSLHIVNGHVTMVLKNSRYVQNGKSIPLTKGKIQLQSEACEVFYKDIQIKELQAMPKQYEGYFN